MFRSRPQWWIQPVDVYVMADAAEWVREKHVFRPQLKTDNQPVQ
jgi:hypothetical protein